MTAKTITRIAASLIMIILLAGLLIWQNARYTLVSECHASGGEWDGAADRCRPVPKIYLERGIKRT